jgi:hypothetical protein
MLKFIETIGLLAYTTIWALIASVLSSKLRASILLFCLGLISLFGFLSHFSNTTYLFSIIVFYVSFCSVLLILSLLVVDGRLPLKSSGSEFLRGDAGPGSGVYLNNAHEYLRYQKTDCEELRNGSRKKKRKNTHAIILHTLLLASMLFSNQTFSRPNLKSEPFTAQSYLTAIVMFSCILFLITIVGIFLTTQKHPRPT